jgi:hypothetical protein
VRGSAQARRGYFFCLIEIEKKAEESTILTHKDIVCAAHPPPPYESYPQRHILIQIPILTHKEHQNDSKIIFPISSYPQRALADPPLFEETTQLPNIYWIIFSRTNKSIKK